jgi:hypothetical protein
MITLLIILSVTAVPYTIEKPIIEHNYHNNLINEKICKSSFSTKQNDIDLDNDSNKVKIQLCISRLSGIEEVTKEISTEEASELSNLLNHVCRCIEESKMNEVQNVNQYMVKGKIFDLYIKLRNYKLLPRDLDFKEFSILISGDYGKRIFVKNNVYKNLNLINISSLGPNNSNDSNNFFCTISGNGQIKIFYPVEGAIFALSFILPFILWTALHRITNSSAPIFSALLLIAMLFSSIFIGGMILLPLKFIKNLIILKPIVPWALIESIGDSKMTVKGSNGLWSLSHPFNVTIAGFFGLWIAIPTTPFDITIPTPINWNCLGFAFGVGRH